VNGLPCRKRKRNPTMRRKGKGGKAGKGRRRGEERRGNVNPKKKDPLQDKEQAQQHALIQYSTDPSLWILVQ